MSEIIGLDGRPLKKDFESAINESEKEPRHIRRRKDRELQKEIKKSLKQDPEFQGRVLDHVKDMLRKAKIPCALVSFPTINGKIHEDTYLTMSDHKLIIHQIEKHEEKTRESDDTKEGG